MDEFRKVLEDVKKGPSKANNNKKPAEKKVKHHQRINLIFPRKKKQRKKLIYQKQCQIKLINQIQQNQ